MSRISKISFKFLSIKIVIQADLAVSKMALKEQFGKLIL